jgi:hypothetical protein
MSLTKLSLAGKNSIIPSQGEFGFSNIPAGDERIANSVSTIVKLFPYAPSYGSEPWNLWGCSREYWMIYYIEDQAFSPSYDFAPPQGNFFNMRQQSFLEDEKCLVRPAVSRKSKPIATFS